MALVVEDGTGLEEADSYISVSDATLYVDSYYTAQSAQKVLWTAALQNSGADAEVSLRRATRDIDATYAFTGDPLTDTHALEFPRYGEDEVPVEVMDATVEMALLILSGHDPTGPEDKSGAIESEKTKLGGLETEVSYFYATDTKSARMNKVETILSPYLSDETVADQIRLVRG
jgi:hypothetical protein